MQRTNDSTQTHRHTPEHRPSVHCVANRRHSPTEPCRTTAQSCRHGICNRHCRLTVGIRAVEDEVWSVTESVQTPVLFLSTALEADLGSYTPDFPLWATLQPPVAPVLCSVVASWGKGEEAAEVYGAPTKKRQHQRPSRRTVERSKLCGEGSSSPPLGAAMTSRIS